MAGPSERNVRPPAVAGSFYPQDPAQCQAEARAFLQVRPGTGGGARWLGGVVPHAGWMFSGAVAGETIAALAAQGPVDVVVIFGAIHTPLHSDLAALDSHPWWRVPGGESNLPVELQGRLTADATGLFVVDDRFHAREHAVEVELPLVQQAWPGAAVLPVEVPVVEAAAQVGLCTARQIEAAGLTAVYLASSDLTHYGPNYRFTPAGIGPDALRWARQNDRRLLQLMTSMSVEQVVPEVRGRLNACGGGAIAAAMAACRHRGAWAGTVLRHTDSFEVLSRLAPTADNSVGYAAVLFG